MRLSTLRVAAALLPSALILHEIVYLLAAERAPAAHGYLATAIPWLAALAASLLAAALLVPALSPERARDRWLEGDRRAPFALAAALVAVFAAQELAEAVLLGGGSAALAGALGASWLALPLALGLGALASAAVDSIHRAGLAVATLADRRRAPVARAERRLEPRSAAAAVLTLAPLAFGLARRPPPPAR